MVSMESIVIYLQKDDKKYILCLRAFCSFSSSLPSCIAVPSPATCFSSAEAATGSVDMGNKERIIQGD
jgi:hypothetical protein